ncbi:MAG: ATP-dependent DNA helicase DinG [Desulfuromonadia bacterium]
MPDILDRFTPQAIEFIRDAINEARGNELFFLGLIDSSRRIDEVEILARGNISSVPALVGSLPVGSVAIHNHPSGNLDPSPQDLEIASILGNNGVGFSIVDNGVTRDYEVVPPFVPKEVELISEGEITTFFGPKGRLSFTFPDFEVRDEQIEMSRGVADAFNRERIALIEAGTGTGKSLAYLFPAILWGTRNRERVVVSTNTINLQEQLLTKDLPLLRKATGIPFRSVLVKGRGNYLCRRKLMLRHENLTLFDDGRGEERAAIFQWSRQTSDGSKSDLGFLPSHEVWEELCCEADQCLRVRCRFYVDCFYYAARRRAASADILVVNHALLVTDLALKDELDQGALPPYSRLIIDEAHHLEDAATTHLGRHLSARLVQRTIERLHNSRKPGVGLLDQFLSLLGRHLGDSHDALYTRYSILIEDSLFPSVTGIEQLAVQIFDLITIQLRRQGGEGGDQITLRVTEGCRRTPLWEETQRSLQTLGEALSTFVERMREFDAMAGEIPSPAREVLEGHLTDVGGVTGRIREITRECFRFVEVGDDLCRWFELKRLKSGQILRLCTAPIVVDTLLDEILFSRMKTVILTSATLTVNDRFDYLSERTGIVHGDKERVATLLLPSPFDYTNQIRVCLPEDIPEPGEGEYRESIADLVERAITISGGRAFVLFTSYDLLSHVHRHLLRQGRDFTLLKQGEHDRHTLLTRFRGASRGVLLGTDSFWEGVDVKGEALELVIIIRLPFKVPTEPIQEARCEYLLQMKKDPFRHLTIPQAVIKFKQGVGRLIRSRWDQGVILVLDSRVTTKSYGRSFLKALPAGVVIRGGWDETRRAMEEFFRKGR